ncbi:hypothetical protein, partial [Klebsiella pneumoniae]|uniref:hypothetical protein n=1 Tax=Klebsiella pneumoniae TaxID=573 RepID=UPI0022B5EFC1
IPEYKDSALSHEHVCIPLHRGEENFMGMLLNLTLYYIVAAGFQLYAILQTRQYSMFLCNCPVLYLTI